MRLDTGMFARVASGAVGVVGMASASLAQQAVAPPADWSDPSAVVEHYVDALGIEPIEIMLLGTFHFDDQGLDEYKPTHQFDALAKDRQEQINEVVDDLAAFGPDRICVERRPSGQAALDAWYERFREGGERDEANEIVQIGFSLADRLGHERVHAVDAGGAWLEPQVDPMAFAAENGLIAANAAKLQRLQIVGGSFNAAEDRFIDRSTLTEIYRFMNHEDVIRASHATYIVGSFDFGKDEFYPGVDGFVTHWYNRNLRIFHTIKRVAQPGERIVVLIGAGHVPIIRHLVESSPEFKLVEVRDVIE